MSRNPCTRLDIRCTKDYAPGSMITTTLLSENGTALLEGDDALLDRPGLKWIDLHGPTPERLAPLATRFGLHKLAVEDCLHLDQRPKLEQYPNHHFLVLHGFRVDPADVLTLTLLELHVFIGPDWVISVHEHPIPAIDEAKKRFHADPSGTFGRGVDFIVYALADALVDSNFPLVDSLDEAIEQLEEDIFEGLAPAQLEQMFTLKRILVRLRRILSPQRDVLNLLTRPGGFVGERNALYFRDVYDHLVRVQEQLDSARDLLANARDAYLSAVANRTNDISKQLTIFATIFLPLSFITGFFGQNFDVLSGPVFFWVMLGSIFALPVVLLLWFRHKNWI